MNFEFLKDLDLIGGIYKTCKNAENLVNSMPDSSMGAARKGAENLAKLVYMHVHTNELQKLSFLDILNDSDVRKFLDDRAILNAFHDIRKKGNIATHVIEDEDNNEEALSLLVELHYIAGEIACKMGLIEEYPPFNEDNEEAFVEAVRRTSQDSFNAFLDYENKRPRRRDYMHLHEVLIFPEKPKHPFIYTYLQMYFEYLLDVEQELNAEIASGETKKTVIAAKIIIEDRAEYSTDDPITFREALFNELPDAESFIIDNDCDGYLGVGRDGLIWTGNGMADWLYFMQRDERQFEYKLIGQHYNFGEFLYARLPAPEFNYFGVRSFATKEAFNDMPKGNWWTYGITVAVNFDFEKHMDILERMHDVVRSYMSGIDLQYCVNEWEYGNFDILISDIQWILEDLTVAQNFFDEINSIMAPIRDICECSVAGDWQDWDQFGIGVTEWTKEDGFQIKVVWY